MRVFPLLIKRAREEFAFRGALDGHPPRIESMRCCRFGYAPPLYKTSVPPLQRSVGP